MCSVLWVYATVLSLWQENIASKANGVTKLKVKDIFLLGKSIALIAGLMIKNLMFGTAIKNRD